MHQIIRVEVGSDSGGKIHSINRLRLQIPDHYREFQKHYFVGDCIKVFVHMLFVV